MFYVTPGVVLSLSLMAFGAAADDVRANPAPASAPAASSAPAVKPLPPLCFKVSKLCLGRKASASSSSTVTEVAAPQTGTAGSAPSDATQNYAQVPEAVVREFLAQLPQNDTDSGVVVTAPQKSIMKPDLDGPGAAGIPALIWALKHPTQAWRIFLPAPSPAPSEP